MGNQRGLGPARGRGPAVAGVVALVMALSLASGRAATPSSGTIDGSRPVAWDFAAVGGGTPVSTGQEDNCTPTICDNYDLTVKLPAAPRSYFVRHTATLLIKQTWNSPSPNNDLDIFAIGPDGAKYGPGKPDTQTSGANEEDLTILDPLAGVYHVRSVAATTIPTASHAVATLTVGTRFSLAAKPNPKLGEPVFAKFVAPPSLGNTAFEPSIGADWNTGKVMYLAYEQPLRVTFNDSVHPATATWEDVSSPFTSPPVERLPVCPTSALPCRLTGSDDPILWTDHDTGRTIVSQLQFYPHCSQTAFSDDDGGTWLLSPKGCGTPSGLDHQTVGGGPFAPPLTSPLYPHAVYYCSQELVTAFCSLSLDGGMTFGVGIPIQHTCAQGIHGHVKVAPDGTVFVPSWDCPDANGADRQGVIVSANDGLTWTIHAVPGTKPNGGVGGDPSVGIGAKNTVYFGYVDADGHPKIATSDDRGNTWTRSVDVGKSFRIQNAEFPAVVAGDDNRAAFAFFGSPSPGFDQDPHYTGDWDLFVAITYDGGHTWTTVDVTRDKPVQRGCIWNGGGHNPCRNLDDFFDATVDKQGRILVGYADGCADAACVKNTPDFYKESHVRTSKAVIARLACGKGLFAAYDPGPRDCPASLRTTSVHPTVLHAKLRHQQLPATGVPSPLTGVPVTAAAAIGAAALVATRRRFGFARHTGSRRHR